MSERWSQRRAYATWMVTGLIAWVAIVVGAIVTWRRGR